MQVPETAKLAESLVLLIQELFAGVVIAIDGRVLFTVKVLLAEFRVNGFPARSLQAVVPTIIFAVPFPVQPVMVTVAEVPDTVVDLVQPALAPLMVIPELIVVFTIVPRLVSEKVRV